MALRAQHEIVRLCHSGIDSVQLRREVMDQVRGVVPAEAYCFPTADPATLMITGNVGEGLPPEAAPRFFEVEYSQDDFNKFAELERHWYRASIRPTIARPPRHAAQRWFASERGRSECRAGRGVPARTRVARSSGQ